MIMIMIMMTRLDSNVKITYNYRWSIELFPCIL